MAPRRPAPVPCSRLLRRRTAPTALALGAGLVLAGTLPAAAVPDHTLYLQGDWSGAQCASLEAAVGATLAACEGIALTDPDGDGVYTGESNEIDSGYWYSHVVEHDASGTSATVLTPVDMSAYLDHTLTSFRYDSATGELRASHLGSPGYHNGPGAGTWTAVDEIRVPLGGGGMPQGLNPYSGEFSLVAGNAFGEASKGDPGAPTTFTGSDGTGVPLQFAGIENGPDGPLMVLRFASPEAGEAALPGSTDYSRQVIWTEGRSLHGVVDVNHYPLRERLDAEHRAEDGLDTVVNPDGSVRIRVADDNNPWMRLHVWPEDYEPHQFEPSVLNSFPTYELTDTGRGYHEVTVPAEHQGVKFSLTAAFATPYAPQWREYPVGLTGRESEFTVHGRDGQRIPVVSSASAPGVSVTGLGDAPVALVRDEASGVYTRTLELSAGTYIVAAQERGEATGTPRTVEHAGGSLTLVYDPATDTLQTSAEGIHTVAVTWVMGDTDAWSNPQPAGDRLEALLTDPDGDGTLTATLTAPRGGPARAAVARNLGASLATDHVAFSSEAGAPVTFAYTPATGAWTATPSDPGTYDANADLAFWVDDDTLAVPAELVGAQTQASLAWTPDMAVDWDEARYYDADGRFTGSNTLRRSWFVEPGAFTDAQLAERPELAEYAAFDLDPGSVSDIEGDEGGTAGEDPRAFGTTILSLYERGELSAMTGVAPLATPATVTATLADGRGNSTTVGLPIPAGARPVAGDWDGDGVDTLGWILGNTLTYTAGNTEGGGSMTVATFGTTGAELFVGDFDGDGVDTLGARYGNRIVLGNDLETGSGGETFWYGAPTDELVVGDFDGDGVDTVSVRRGNAIHVNDRHASGNAQRVVWYGEAGEPILTGSTDGEGPDALTIHRGNRFHLQDALRTGNADRVVTLGESGDTGLLGDWDGNGIDTVGVVGRAG